MKVEYPKWIYHKTQDAKIVQTKEEHDEVGKGWQETPFEVSEKQDPKIEESSTSSNQEAESASATEVTYKEHMAEWESKEEKKNKKPKAKKAK